MNPKEQKNIALALGSNLGDRSANIAFALEQLALHGLSNILCAQCLESEPVDCPKNSGIYINTALIGQWSGSALELLDCALKIEKLAGRERSGVINEARVLDIDILLFEDQIYNCPQLTVPHPRMHLRPFVIDPLSEIAPLWIVPTVHKTVRQISRELNENA